ncbi:MAG TPA: hypothetical protein VKV23_01155 [Acidimicrobiales bacterium]|nr:hypothetical protein [Acidimicrobiales bacterium]
MLSARQAGSTGERVAPRLLVSIDVSGRCDHALGAQSADTNLAIDAEAAAPPASVGDVGIPADWRQAVDSSADALERAIGAAPAAAIGKRTAGSSSSVLPTGAAGRR